MKALILVLIFCPSIALAEDIWCKGPSSWERVEAESLEQARYVAQHKWNKQVPCVRGDPSDVFNTDGGWSNRQHLRPFLPPDVQRTKAENGKAKGAVTEDFRCDTNGKFAPDGSQDLTRCYKLTSASMGAWKIRATADDHTWLWRLPDGRLDGAAEFWAEVSPKGVLGVSPEARNYAEGRGFKVDGPTATASSPAEPNSIDCSIQSAEAVLSRRNGGACSKQGQANASPKSAPAPAPASAPAQDCSKLALVQRIKCEALAATKR